MSKQKTLYVFVSALTVLIALVVVNYLASRHYARIDLTERNLYTLSPATRGLLENLDDVVTVRVYFSRDLPPALMPLKRGVDDLLKEFKGVAGGRMQVEYIDPTADPAEEQRALMLGIAPVQLNVVEKDRQELVKVYLGIVVLHGDRMHVLPVVQTTGTLEYRLAQAIVKVSAEQEIAIGWWGPRVPDPVGGGYGGITRLLEERYAVTHIDPEKLDEIDAKHFSTLVLASPGEIGPDALAAIDAYVKSGGKVVALVDRWTIGEKLTATPRKTSLPELLKRYGIEVRPDLVMDHSNAMASFAGSMLTYHLPYPFWPLVRAEDFNEEDPITAELSTLVLPWTSSLSYASAPDADRMEALARTTDRAAVADGDAPVIDPESAGKDLLGRKRLSTYVLALRAKGPAQLVVVGSGRFAQDNFLRRYPANAAFIENAIDVFAMGDRLVGIRSRIGLERPIALLSDSARMGLRAINMAAGPLIVVALGAVVMALRAHRARRVRGTYGRRS